MWMSLVTGLFFVVLLLNQRWSPPLGLQAVHCSTFRIMCDVPSIAVFIIIIIIIIIQYGCLLSQAFSSWYFSWINGGLHRWGFKLQLQYFPYCVWCSKYSCLYYSYTICTSPVTGISSWYFSWTSGDPHRSGFKLHIAVLSVLCVMFQV